MAQNPALELATLLAELDEDSLSNMSDAEILDLRKQLNPYGRTIEGSDNVLTFSYTDLSADYQKKMITTAMVGFLNRMLDEWRVEPGIPVVPVADFVKDPDALDEFEASLQQPELMATELAWHKDLLQKKVFVKEFLEDMFQYNPDLHVRSAYVPNPNDPERSLIDTPSAQLAIWQLKKTNPAFKEAMLQYDREQFALEKQDKGEKAPIPEIVLSELRKTTTETIPPADIFHRFQYYYDSNYEELQSVVTDLYCCKPEFVTAVNPYAWHKSIGEADEFINKHKEEVIASIFKAESGKWNIIAPFKKVRESVRFFNKKTQVLEAIANQIEADSKIGAELMRKRIKIQKKKNIAKEGPDDPAFVKWKASNTTLKDMGADTLKEDDLDDECPEDALEVPVFRVSKGGMKIERTKFYTEVVAPDPDMLNTNK
jgi:hypothetical protein